MTSNSRNRPESQCVYFMTYALKTKSKSFTSDIIKQKLTTLTPDVLDQRLDKLLDQKLQIRDIKP